MQASMISLNKKYIHSGYDGTEIIQESFYTLLVTGELSIRWRINLPDDCHEFVMRALPRRRLSRMRDTRILVLETIVMHA